MLKNIFHNFVWLSFIFFCSSSLSSDLNSVSPGTSSIGACDSDSNDLDADLKSMLRISPVHWSKHFPTLSSWINACSVLLKNRECLSSYNFQSPFSALTDKQRQDEFAALIIQWMDIMVAQMEQDELWQVTNDTLSAKPDKSFFDIEHIPQFTPYVQKLIATQNDRFYFRGDLHGDIFSLLKQLENMRNRGVIDDYFRIIDENVWMIFLGDYVDRGNYGCEVMYTLMRLVLANPDRVILVRGNHEDCCMQVLYNFRSEVVHKFQPIGYEIYTLILRMYELLPVVLYLGCHNEDGSVVNYLQCCHGGLEIGFDPRSFLNCRQTKYQRLGNLSGIDGIDKILKHSSNFDNIDKRNLWNDKVRNFFAEYQDRLLKGFERFNCMNIGFLWSDFIISGPYKLKIGERGPGMLAYGQEATSDILSVQSSSESTIIGVFRGHQHGETEMMSNLIACDGVYQLWTEIDKQQATSPYVRDIVASGLSNPAVVTFNVGPDSSYGVNHGFEKDAFAVLTVYNQLRLWSLEVFNTQVLPPVIRNISNRKY